MWRLFSSKCWQKQNNWMSNNFTVLAFAELTYCYYELQNRDDDSFRRFKRMLTTNHSSILRCSFFSEWLNLKMLQSIHLRTWWNMIYKCGWYLGRCFSVFFICYVLFQIIISIRSFQNSFSSVHVNDTMTTERFFSLFKIYHLILRALLSSIQKKKEKGLKSCKEDYGIERKEMTFGLYYLSWTLPVESLTSVSVWRYSQPSTILLF